WNDANPVPAKPAPRASDSVTRAGRADRRMTAITREGTAMPTFDTPEPITLTVEISVGDIRIVASERTDTTVEVRPTNSARKGDVTAAQQTQVLYADGRLLIKAPKGWRHFTPFGGRES